MLETILGLVVGLIVGVPLVTLFHLGNEYGRREGIVAKKDDRDE